MTLTVTVCLLLFVTLSVAQSSYTPDRVFLVLSHPEVNEHMVCPLPISPQGTHCALMRALSPAICRHEGGDNFVCLPVKKRDAPNNWL